MKSTILCWQTFTTGLSDVSTVATLNFDFPVSTTRIRIFPVTIGGTGANPTMQFEVLGCRGKNTIRTRNTFYSVGVV